MDKVDKTFDGVGLGQIENLKEIKESLEEKNRFQTKAIMDSKGRFYATGKRKTASARVWVKPGRGDVQVNKKASGIYFSSKNILSKLSEPFVVTEREGSYNVWCTVQGGGISAQAEAIRAGISKALECFEPSLRSVLKKAGFLKVDSRQVERKKPGLSGARKRYQFSKR